MNLWEAFLQAARERGETEDDIAKKSRPLLASGNAQLLMLENIPAGDERGVIEHFKKRGHYYKKLWDEQPDEAERMLEVNTERVRKAFSKN